MNRTLVLLKTLDKLSRLQKGLKASSTALEEDSIVYNFKASGPIFEIGYSSIATSLKATAYVDGYLQVR